MSQEEIESAINYTFESNIQNKFIESLQRQHKANKPLSAKQVFHLNKSISKHKDTKYLLKQADQDDKWVIHLTEFFENRGFLSEKQLGTLNAE